MKKEFIKCEFCGGPISSEVCQLAVHRIISGGKEYIFCCEKCVKRYRKRGNK